MSELSISVSSSGFVGKEVEALPLKKSSGELLANTVENNRQKDDLEDSKALNKPELIEDRELHSIVNEVNEKIKISQPNFSLAFSIDGETGEKIVKVIDKENDEVIRQIPSEELVVLRKKMDDLTGILFDEKV